jgi:hypothetical protein
VTRADTAHSRALAQRLAEAEAIIEALLSSQVDAVVEPQTKSPILLVKAQEALRLSQMRLRDIGEPDDISDGRRFHGEGAGFSCRPAQGTHREAVRCRQPQSDSPPLPEVGILTT